MNPVLTFVRKFLKYLRFCFCAFVSGVFVVVAAVVVVFVCLFFLFVFFVCLFVLVFCLFACLFFVCVFPLFKSYLCSSSVTGVDRIRLSYPEIGYDLHLSPSLHPSSAH